MHFQNVVNTLMFYHSIMQSSLIVMWAFITIASSKYKPTFRTLKFAPQARSRWLYKQSPPTRAN